MPKILQTIRFLFGPAIVGLLAAFLIVIFFPDYFPSTLSQRVQNLLTKPEKQYSIADPVSYSRAVDKAAVSVVNIYTLRQQAVNTRFNPFTGRYSGTENKVLPSTGSGVIVSKDGYIVTNFHVLKSAKDIRVALQDGREATPEIVGFSKEDDMAVLKIELDGLHAIEIGDPDTAKVGDVVLAIGNPFGVGQTVTQGIISGTRRKGLNISIFENFIQTDAAINPGNSGGALIDVYGRLLGINIGDLRQTYFGDASGIGFAIPADRAIQAVNDIVEHGRVVRGWLGVSAVDINEKIAETLKLPTLEGVLITEIYQNGPADVAGLLTGDVLIAIQGKKTNSMLTAIQEFANLRPGDILDLDIMRAGEKITLQAVLSAAPE